MCSAPYITSVVSGVDRIGKIAVRKYKDHILKEIPSNQLSIAECEVPVSDEKC